MLERCASVDPALRIAGLLLLLCTTACGYRFVRYDSGLGDVRTVAIQTLRNDSFEPGVERVVTDALLREFLRRGGVRVVEDPGRADLVLSGAVLPLLTHAQSLSAAVFVLEEQVALSLALEARRGDGTLVPLHASAQNESEVYLVSADVEATRKNREEAIRRLAGVLAGRVHDALAEGLAP